MLFMVIEHFPQHDMLPVYQRVRDGGRALPDGLKYVDSWVEPNFSRCFQLMECDDARLLRVDLDAVRTAPGVVLVLTAADPKTCWPSARSTVSRPS